MNKRSIFIAVVLLAVFGCSDPSSTEQASGSTEPPVVEVEQGEIEPIDLKAAEEQLEEAKATTLAPIDLRLVVRPGQSQEYRLTNEITIVTQSQYDASQTEESKSYLNADQSVVVDESETFFIHTTGVEGAVEGEGMMTAIADTYMQATVKAIEGSTMVAAYDEKASGKNIVMIGDGIGLNPLGTQAGSQDSVTGFMGVLLPGGTVKPGDSWTGVYDVEHIAGQVFSGKGARTSTGTMPLTYFLIGYDVERGLAHIGIFGSGSPLVELPLDEAMVHIQLHIKIKGEAFVRLSDGWLDELNLQTDVETEGYVAVKLTAKTVTKLIK